MINMPKLFKSDPSETLVLPLLPLRDIVVFPYMVAPLFVGRPKSINALAEAMNNEKLVFLATQKNAGIDNPSKKDIATTGTIGKVLQLLRLPDGTVKALVEGGARGKIVRFVENEEFFQVELEVLKEPAMSTAEAATLTRAVVDSFEEYAERNKNISKDLLTSIAAIDDPGKLADTVASHFSFKIEDKIRLLETVDVKERLPLLLSLIKIEIEVFEMDQRIKNRVKEQMEKTQKNYYSTSRCGHKKRKWGRRMTAAMISRNWKKR